MASPLLGKGRLRICFRYPCLGYDPWTPLSDLSERGQASLSERRPTVLFNILRWAGARYAILSILSPLQTPARAHRFTVAKSCRSLLPVNASDLTTHRSSFVPQFS